MECDRILKIIEKVHKRQGSGSRAAIAINGLLSTASHSSVSGAQEDADFVDGTDSSDSRSFGLRESRAWLKASAISGVGMWNSLERRS